MTFKRNDDLPFQTVDEEAVVVNPQTREVHVLNQTGARIWELLRTEHTLDQLVLTLETEFDLDPSRGGDGSAAIRREVISFVNDLARRELVTERATSGR